MREMMRLWLRNLSHRSCSALAAALEMIFVVMATSLWKCSWARRGALKLVPRCVGVNSTFSNTFPLALPVNSAEVQGAITDAGQ